MLNLINTQDNLFMLVLALVLLYASIYDIFFKEVNKITFTSLFILAIITQTKVYPILAFILITILFYGMGWCGAGDLKVFLLLSASLGWSALGIFGLFFVLWSFVSAFLFFRWNVREFALVPLILLATLTFYILQTIF